MAGAASLSFGRSGPLRGRGGIVLAMALAASVVAVFLGAQRSGEEAETERLTRQSALYASALSGTLDRFAYLPSLLGQIPVVVAALDGEGAAANAWLERAAGDMDVEALYVMDAAGLTVAASNHRRSMTFLGQNYGFRPYFKAAIRGEPGEFFAIGATTARPGYFFAAAVEAGGAIRGVVAVKLDLSPLVARWRAGGERVMVANRDGIVVLSSDPALTYRALAPLPAEALDRIAASRHFGDRTLDPLDWRTGEGNEATLDGERVLVVSRALGRAGWTLHVLADGADATRRALTSAALFAAVLGTLALAWTFLRAARMRAALATSRAEEAKLSTLNRRLRGEVTERRAAEEGLRVAQRDLARASRLAALGEVSATVTHELGQPLSALRNYLVAAELNPARRDDPLIPQIEGVVRRMERTTAQLRDFSRPARRDFGPVDLREVVRSAHALMAHDLDAASVACAFDCTAADAVIEGNAHGLEQVVVNLMRNAVAAMREAREKRLDIVVSTDADTRPVLTVRDTGEGFGGADIETATAPFYTTRSSGDGMGLGLAISAAILREHGATLRARDREEGAGAAIEVTFPRPADGDGNGGEGGRDADG